MLSTGNVGQWLADFDQISWSLALETHSLKWIAVVRQASEVVAMFLVIYLFNVTNDCANKSDDDDENNFAIDEIYNYTNENF